MDRTPVASVLEDNDGFSLTRAIIHNDDLVVRLGRSADNGLYAGPEKVEAVPCGNDDGHLSFGRSASYPQCRQQVPGAKQALLAHVLAGQNERSRPLPTS